MLTLTVKGMPDSLVLQKISGTAPRVSKKKKSHKTKHVLFSCDMTALQRWKYWPSPFLLMVASKVVAISNSDTSALHKIRSSRIKKHHPAHILWPINVVYDIRGRLRRLAWDTTGKLNTHAHTHSHALVFCYVLWGTTQWPPGGVNQYMSVCVCRPFENNTVCVCGHKWGAMALREPAEFWPVLFHDALTSNIDMSSICLPEFICRLSLVQFPFCLSCHGLSGLLNLSS